MINLFPWREQESSLHLFIACISLVVIVSLTTLLLFVLRAHLTCKTGQFILATKNLDKQIKNQLTLKNNLIVEGKKIAELKKYAQLRCVQTRVRNFLDNFSERMPSNILIRSILYEHEKLFFEGVLLSSNQESIKKFVAALGKRNGISLKNLNVTQMGGQKFMFKIFFIVGLVENCLL